MAIGGTVTPTGIGHREREARALELRKAGATYEAIAADLGLSNRTAGRRVVVRALQRLTDEPAAEVKALELKRLDALYELAFAEAAARHLLVRGSDVFDLEDVGPKLKAIEVCLTVMERRAKLLGLDAPAKARVEVITEDAVDAEIRRLSAEVGAVS